MSNLISRSEVINLLCNLHIDNVAVNGKRVTEYIRELPTAYDVEAVVEEIARRDTTDGTVKVFSGREVIDIVRKGGVE